MGRTGVAEHCRTAFLQARGGAGALYVGGRASRPSPSPTLSVMQRIYSHPNPGMVELARGELARHGIAAVVRGEYLAPATGEGAAWADSWPALWMAGDERLPEAVEVVRAFVAASEEGEGEGGAPWACPGCGEAVEAAFGACWRCGAERPEAQG